MIKVNNTGFRNLAGIVISLFSVLLFPGCQKVINVDLNEAAPKIVIEGMITDKRGPYSVTITKSGSYFNQPVLPTVSGAQVYINDDFGLTDSLREAAPGIYITSRTRGVPGRTYTLRVVSENLEYTGTSTMFSHVSIDSLKIVKSEFQRFDPDGKNRNKNQYELHCFFKDPLEKNFYRIRVMKNDSINTQSYRLYDDQYTNGLVTELRVSNAEAGNTYRIELLSLDKATYAYYRSLADLLYTNPFFGSTPANPETNLRNGALGYFGAAALSSRTFTITQDIINSVH